MTPGQTSAFIRTIAGLTQKELAQRVGATHPKAQTPQDTALRSPAFRPVRPGGLKPFASTPRTLTP